MSEKEFIIQKSKLMDALDEINNAIGMSATAEWEQSVSDDVFIQRASEFIISQKLTNRTYINHKRLATSVDTEVLKTFVNSVADSITMDAGRIKQIVFKNGLSHKFAYED